MPIDVVVRGTEEEIILSIHNMGIPISAHKIPKLFDSLSPGERGNGKAPSEQMHLGLGLYIVREIVAAHGGTISVTSSEKDGTTFTAYIPRMTPLMSVA